MPLLPAVCPAGWIEEDALESSVIAQRLRGARELPGVVEGSEWWTGGRTIHWLASLPVCAEGEQILLSTPSRSRRGCFRAARQLLPSHKGHQYRQMAATEAPASTGGLHPQDIFVSAAANRYSHAADWGSIQAKSDGERISVLAYGTHRSIALAYNLGVSMAKAKSTARMDPSC